VYYARAKTEAKEFAVKVMDKDFIKREKKVGLGGVCVRCALCVWLGGEMGVVQGSCVFVC
jgi:hypothetical protein